MDPVDETASRLAIETMRNEDAACRQQLDAKLKSQPWLEVATFAATHCQTRALRLAPWQFPPCAMDAAEAAHALSGEDLHGRRAATDLLKRMLSLGISRWHPDPMGAIAEAERKRTAA